MQNETKELKNQLHWMKLLLTVNLLLLGFVFFSSFKPSVDDLLRVRGLVIVDESGRERMLIGYPIPESKHRFRDNPERVIKEWAAERGGAEFADRYKNDFYNKAEGIVFLNEAGYDRMAIGERLPDPSAGVRQFESAGIAVFDEKGHEYAGFGLSKTKEGKYRTVLGMDDPEVGESMHMFILEDGSRGLQIAHPGGRLLLGSGPKNGWVFNSKEDFVGLKAEDKEGKTLLEHNALKSNNQ
ncbi:hypothetical protein D0X99_16520 [Algoriphagus lacus]|uniref:Uncharacterized protein n=2 Tax=Algoriphagus lacus TaxID=2056311 RepID=A0A418PNG9_9BACT|nr:hypothetical protein D0X99_16520 [Algoriphagus lacus]